MKNRRKIKTHTLSSTNNITRITFEIKEIPKNSIHFQLCFHLFQHLLFFFHHFSQKTKNKKELRQLITLHYIRRLVNCRSAFLCYSIRLFDGAVGRSIFDAWCLENTRINRTRITSAFTCPIAHDSDEMAIEMKIIMECRRCRLDEPLEPFNFAHLLFYFHMNTFEEAHKENHFSIILFRFWYLFLFFFPPV